MSLGFRFANYFTMCSWTISFVVFEVISYIVSQKFWLSFPGFIMRKASLFYVNALILTGIVDARRDHFSLLLFYFIIFLNVFLCVG